MLNASEHVEVAEQLLDSAPLGNTADEKLLIALMAIAHALIANAKKPTNVYHTHGI